MSITPSVSPHAPRAAGGATASPVVPPPPLLEFSETSQTARRLNHRAVAHGDLAPYSPVGLPVTAYAILHGAVNALPRTNDAAVTASFTLRVPRWPLVCVEATYNTSAGHLTGREVLSIAAAYRALEDAAEAGVDVPTRRDIARLAGMDDRSSTNAKVLVASLQRASSLLVHVDTTLQSDRPDLSLQDERHALTQILTLEWTSVRKGATRVETWIDRLAFAPLFTPEHAAVAWTDLGVLRALECDEARFAYLALAHRVSAGDLQVGAEVVLDPAAMVDLCGARQFGKGQKSRALRSAIAALRAADVVYDVELPKRRGDAWRFRAGRALWTSQLSRLLSPTWSTQQRAMGLMLRAMGVADATVGRLLADHGTEVLREMVLWVMWRQLRPRKNEAPISNPGGFLVAIAAKPEEFFVTPDFEAWRESLRRPAAMSLPAPVVMESELAPLTAPTDDALEDRTREALLEAITVSAINTAHRDQMCRMLDEGRIVRDAVVLHGYHWIPNPGSSAVPPFVTAIQPLALSLRRVVGGSVILQVGERTAVG
jgi:hypothetical protein